MANKFKVLRGTHNEGGKTYAKGDVLESASDLSKHNVKGITPKFLKLDDDHPIPSDDDPVVEEEVTEDDEDEDDEDEETENSFDISEVEFTQDYLSNLTVAQLDEIAEQVGTEVSGNKADKVNQLIDAMS